MRSFCALLVAALILATHAPSSFADDRFGPDDLARLADVAEPEFSPDGEWLAYSVTTANVEADLQQSDIWRVSWDGERRQKLTSTNEYSEWSPRWSPDGRRLAFLSDRGGEDATTQIWITSANGGRARKLTDFPGGVEDFVWAPDGRRLAIIATDPERPEGAAEPINPPPIVIDRYQFKQDGVGYLTDRRQHLYVFDIEARTSILLTPGDHDERAPAWSPDGRHIAYVTKRGDDPDRTLNFDIYLVAPEAGAAERQLTTFAGADLDPDWGARPSWSPDGSRIAYLQGGEDRWIYYAPARLAVIDVATGSASMPTPLDLWFYNPRWAPDGRSILALIEGNRVTRLSRIDVETGAVSELTPGARFEYDFAVSANGRIATLGGDVTRPYELAAVEGEHLRPLTYHNGWLRDLRLAPVEEISFASADGTQIDGFLVRPLDYEPGRAYPTILRLHGGPVYQYSHEFMADWQAYASAGFAVIAVNPRGSSGRGFDFSRAIYANWGQSDVADVLAAVDHVVSLGVADPARLGVGGWSYGGMLTNYVIASDRRFAAAISGAGIANIFAGYGHDQYVREYTLELGLPWSEPEVYARNSYPFLHADRIATPTLFQCAELDFNVPCLGSEQMYQALRERDLATELVIYPGENHELVVPSYVRDRMERNIAWYRRFLQAGSNP